MCNVTLPHQAACTSPARAYPQLGILLVACALVINSDRLQAQQIPLQALVTPSTKILKDGRIVPFALHSFIEFHSLAELFPFIDSQTTRWKNSLDDAARQALGRELLRRGIESRVVSMTDERPMETPDHSYLTRTPGRVGTRDRTHSSRLRRQFPGRAGEMEALTQLLERGPVHSCPCTFQLVSDRGGYPTLWRHLRFNGALLASREVPPGRHDRRGVRSAERIRASRLEQLARPP